MRKSVAVFLLLGSSLAIANTPTPYLGVNNMTKSSTLVVSYETKSGHGTMTVPAGINQGVPTFPEGEEVKNINFIVFGGKLVDQSSCGFVFDQAYNFVNIKLTSSKAAGESEQVTATCEFN